MAAVVVMQCCNPVFMLIGSWEGEKTWKATILWIKISSGRPIGN